MLSFRGEKLAVGSWQLAVGSSQSHNAISQPLKKIL
jgi:hypothetical protein